MSAATTVLHRDFDLPFIFSGSTSVRQQSGPTAQPGREQRAAEGIVYYRLERFALCRWGAEPGGFILNRLGADNRWVVVRFPPGTRSFYLFKARVRVHNIVRARSAYRLRHTYSRRTTQQQGHTSTSFMRRVLQPIRLVTRTGKHLLRTGKIGKIRTLYLSTLEKEEEAEGEEEKVVQWHRWGPPADPVAVGWGGPWVIGAPIPTKYWNFFCFLSVWFPILWQKAVRSDRKFANN